MPFEHALRPGSIGTLALPNRIVMGSMHLGIEHEDDGRGLAAFYAERALGGTGLIVTGGSAISRVGAGGRSYGFINDGSAAPAFARVAAAVRETNGRIALQLFHAGRYAFASSFGLQPVAPSAVQSKFSRDAPRAMTAEEIAQTIDDFALGAERARALGYDAVEVMASEGYLLNQFLSPLTNRREDEWGGDFERRMAFPRAVLRAIRLAVGAAFPIIFRISGADLMEGSTSEDEVRRFAQVLATDGVDALNVGVGWHESSVPTVQQIVPEGVWIRNAAAIKRAVGHLPVIASNRITTLETADAVLASGAADFISMARPFLADAQIVRKAARGEAINICIACNQACIDRSLSDEKVSCMVNPRAVRELEFPESFATGRERCFAVIGGGPAGMEAARALAALGQRVELFEAAAELGGQFRMARRVPGKRDFGETIRFFAAELARRGVTIHLNRRITGADAALLAQFDGIVLASGVLPRRVAIEGSDLPHVVSYAELLLGERTCGKRVAVIGGGGIGVDVAHLLSYGEAEECDDVVRFLVEQGLASSPNGELRISGRKAVAIMRRGSTIGARIGKSTRWTILRALRSAGVEMYTGVSYGTICADGVLIRDADGREQLIPADTVVIAAGQERNDELASTISRLRVPYRVVGGARNAEELNAVRAFEEGLRAAHELVKTLCHPELVEGSASKL
jgi:2,4-dienoyl-CoA reductase (NADPH2)